MTEDHDMILTLDSRVKTLEREVGCMRAERNRALWGLVVTLFGIIGSGVVYIWTTHR